jgi:glutamate synthase (NADPH/NADH) small chain
VTSGSFTGAETITFRARGEVRAGLGAGAEAAGRLEHDVGAELAPRQRRGIGLCEDRDLDAVDREPAPGRLDDVREAAVDGVAPQQLDERVRVEQVVDRDELDVGLLREGGAERGAADPAEAVDGDACGHVRSFHSSRRRNAYLAIAHEVSQAKNATTTADGTWVSRPMPATPSLLTMSGPSTASRRTATQITAIASDGQTSPWTKARRTRNRPAVCASMASPFTRTLPATDAREASPSRHQRFSATGFRATPDAVPAPPADPGVVLDELRPPLGDAEALLEADRCLECGVRHAVAPCLDACPADVDVPRFVAQIAAGDLEAAADTIFEQNLLGATCARVCPVEVLCQGACVLERPIEIARLQRAATDAALAAGRPLRAKGSRNGRRVAVIGAGPAGLAAAGELAVRGFEVTVYDEREEGGGLVRYAIAPYRQQAEPLPDELRALRELGVRVELGRPVRSRAELEELTDEADVVFLAVGMGPDEHVALLGDDLPGVWASLEFIEAIKTGRAPDVGRRVVVVGAGNTAIDCARLARRLGAPDVTIAYRRTGAELPAYAHEVAEARDEGVRFRWLTAPLRYLGTTRLSGVECTRMRLGEPDASGRRRPEPVPDSTFVLEADMAVAAIGQRPRLELLDWIDGLELERGRLVVDPETGQTGNPRFFAGGDVVNGGQGVVQAVRDAKRAARAIAERVEAPC